MRTIFNWLCRIVEDRHAKRSWHILLEILFETEFYILIGNDSNRCADGIELRYEYGLLKEENISEPCSVLEMLIGLARRMDYELSDDQFDRTGFYFWKMIRNLGLLDCDDNACNRIPHTETKIRTRIKRFMDRDYQYSGEGGLFPLRFPTRDQRDIEIWYQMNAYLSENYPC